MLESFSNELTLLIFFRNYGIYRTINPLSTGWKTGFSGSLNFLFFPSDLIYALVIVPAIFFVFESLAIPFLVIGWYFVK